MNRISAENKGAPGKIHALTSLRFFAALFVVFYHTVSSFLPTLSPANFFAKASSLGYISVSFFFLLSGYILGEVYLRRPGGISVRAFFQARFARIYPLFFLTLALDTPFLYVARVGKYGLKAALIKTGITFAANCVMLQAWITRLRGIDNPNWSLSVETVFYLGFPFIGAALWRLRGISLWLTAALLYFGGQGLVYAVGQRASEDLAKFCPLLHLSTFALGILLSRWKFLATPQTPKAARPDVDTTQTMSILLLAISILALAAIVYKAPSEGTSLNLHDGALAPLFGCLIWSLSTFNWLPARLLSTAWLVVLGEASFGLYLFHLPVFHLFDALGWTHSRALFPVYLAASIGLSVVSFYYFEAPVRRWILSWGNIRVKENLELASDAQ